MTYPSDLTDVQWEVPKPFLLRALGKSNRGRPSLKGLRHTLDALLDLVKTGCQWRFLP